MTIASKFGDSGVAADALLKLRRETERPIDAILVAEDERVGTRFGTWSGVLFGRRLHGFPMRREHLRNDKLCHQNKDIYVLLTTVLKRLMEA